MQEVFTIIAITVAGWFLFRRIYNNFKPENSSNQGCDKCPASHQEPIKK